LPNWNDEAEVAKLAGELVAKKQVITNRYRDYRKCVLEGRDQDPSDTWARIEFAEKAAVEAARRGDLAPLAALLRSEEDRDWLQPDTIELVIEFMTGKRNPHTGKRKGEVGRRKMTEEEREAKNPIHIAAVEFRVIQSLLRELYPMQSKAVVRDRAVKIAAQRAGVTSERLHHHLNRSQSDRRRLG
jgi:hypothetical protein